MAGTVSGPSPFCFSTSLHGFPPSQSWCSMDYLVNGFWAAFALLANMDDATFSAITATLVSTSYAMAA